LLDPTRNFVWLTSYRHVRRADKRRIAPVLWTAGLITADKIPSAMLRWWMSDAFGMIP